MLFREVNDLNRILNYCEVNAVCDLFLPGAVRRAGRSSLAHRGVVSHPRPTDGIQWRGGAELSQVHTAVK